MKILGKYTDKRINSEIMLLEIKPFTKKKG